MPNPGHPTWGHEVPPPPPGAPSCCTQGAQRQLVKSCAVGLVTGPHAHTPCAQINSSAGPGRTSQGRAVGGRRMPSSGHPTRGTGSPIPRASSCHPHGAQRELLRACTVGLVTAPLPAAPVPKGTGQRAPPACPKDGWLGEGECLTLDTPLRGKRRPPRAASCCPHGAQR